MPRPWQIWIDTGGTFTDCIAINPEGKTKRLKILSNSVLRGRIVEQNGNTVRLEMSWPVEKDIFSDFTVTVLAAKKIEYKIQSVDVENSLVVLDRPIKQELIGSTVEISSGEEVPVLAARLVTLTSLRNEFPEIEMKLGSTRGTNALLEKKGARTALLITKGFEDLLKIGTQQRPDLFALHIEKIPPLNEVAIGIAERIDSNGEIVEQLDEKSVAAAIRLLKKNKVESIAIALINSYKNPKHEIQIKEALQNAGFKFVVSSHELSSQIKILPRAETTVADAYLAPIIQTYIGKIRSGLGDNRLRVMTSSGGLMDSKIFRPKESLLSGPAGGVVGAKTVAALSNENMLITFDMGGTSTDVSLYNDRYDYRFESKVGDVKILSPSLAIETIAAGGGSICDFDGYKFTVGPHSAGASPGPACYGAGGPLTITDVNLLLGRIEPEFFALPLQPKKSEEALEKLLRKARQVTRKKFVKEQVLASLLQIANEKMADAVKKVSVTHGLSPTDFTLLTFGGAGGQHACSLAAMLGMRKILVPYDAGLLSAYGIGHARIDIFEELLILQKLANIENRIPEMIDGLFDRGKSRMMLQGLTEGEIDLDKVLVYLRYENQDSSLEIEWSKGSDLKKLFLQKYESIYGHTVERNIEVESIKIVVVSKVKREKASAKNFKTHHPSTKKSSRSFVLGKWKRVPLYRWEELLPGATIQGPAIVGSNNSTTFVEAGWKFFLDQNNNAILQGASSAKKIKSLHTDEAALELFSNRFTSIAQNMGAALQRSAFSVNVKERLDFSCALLDPQGFLVVNAPHIPVHLGSLGLCVREVLKKVKVKRGDVIIANHPAYGGSHLPDVTLIKPVYFKNKLVGFVANRAHHAEIGGKKPGSMPADATRLEEEGVIIPPTFLVKNGKVNWEKIAKLFTNAKFPSRLPEENYADINGALASIHLGEKELIALCERESAPKVLEFMQRLKAYSSRLLSEKIKQTKGKSFSAEEYLDDGAKLKVKINLHSQGLQIDFSGSAKKHPGNLNATRAIVQSVILYVLRLWVDKPIAMNEGLMERVKIILPIGMLNPDFSNPQNLPAVVGGNTEVSQRLTDTLLKAFKMAACSQGTMNNFLFGNERFGYYETIGGGSGSVLGHPGADAVHTHMTNTRITDPEILEHRYPVRLNRFSIRKNSGGTGKWRGGDGIIREFLFNEKMSVNILAQHRSEKPFGLMGGGPGKTGKQVLIRKTGQRIALRGLAQAEVQEGDRILIETPGGGGTGRG